jgi:putative transcriptional regulator
MKINEVIRKYRKEQNLTQEQVANYLGISAPAVNKWENGISYPDITLLAPLARVLKTNVDTLLSFREELTDNEINQFIKEISSEISTKGYENVFEKASTKIKEYPNCEKLILYVAQIMNGYLVMGLQDISEKEKYQKQIISWFENVAFSSNKELANMAIMSLSQNYITSGEYDEAQKLLDQIPPVGYDKRITQASLYNHQGLKEKAYQIYEGMIYQYSNSVISSLMQIITLLCEQKDYDTALEYAQLASTVAKHFDLGKYIGASSKLTIYLKLQDVEKSIQALEETIDGINEMSYPINSKLYRHMIFNDGDGMKDMKKMMKKSFEVDEELDFLRDNPKFKILMNKL